METEEESIFEEEHIIQLPSDIRDGEGNRVKLGLSIGLDVIRGVPGGNGGGEAHDPEFTNVEFLSAFDDTVDADESSNGYGINYNAVAANADQQLFGQDTIAFGGSSMNLTGADNVFEFVSGTFVVEAWVYPTGTAGGTIASIYSTSNNTRNWDFAIDDTSGSVTGTPNAVRWTSFPSGTSTAGAFSFFGPALARDAWNYVVIKRVGDTHTLYVGQVDGNATPGTPEDSTVRPSGAGTRNPQFGDLGSGGAPFPGRISETRITLGEDFLPDEAFPVPSAPFPRS